MRSWDFFDTLLGRSTGREPWRLFDSLGGAEWRAIRQQAEREAGAPGFEAIWQRLAAMGETRGLCSGHEWQRECDAAFPIHANVSQVQADDIIVSDTYFTDGQVRHLARLIGIPDSVRIIATPDGKWSGRIWPTLPRELRDHTGDNRKADVTSPRGHGINGTHFREAEWSARESEVVTAGFPEAAAAMRTARLQCPHDSKTIEHAAWMAQATGNIRFLWMAAAAVHEATAAASRVLFASRSALLLGRVFSRLYPRTETGELFVSRQSLMNPSPSFVAYVREAVSAPGTAVIDLHGTGHSVSCFEKATGVSIPMQFVMAVSGAARNGRMYCPFIAEAGSGLDGSAIEAASYDTRGRTLDVVGGEPVRAFPEYDASYPSAAHAAIDSALRYYCQPCRAPTPDELRRASRMAAADVPRALLRQHQPVH